MSQRHPRTSDKTLPHRIYEALRMLFVGVRLGSDKPQAIDPHARRGFRFVLARPKGARTPQHILYRRRLLFDIRNASNARLTDTDIDLGFQLEIKANSNTLEVFRWGELALTIPMFRIMSKAAMRSALDREFFGVVYDAVLVEQGEPPQLDPKLPRCSPLHTSRPVKPLEGVIYARPANRPPPRFRPLDVDYDRVDYRGEVFEFSVDDIIPEK